MRYVSRAPFESTIMNHLKPAEDLALTLLFFFIKFDMGLMFERIINRSGHLLH